MLLLIAATVEQQWHSDLAATKAWREHILKVSINSDTAMIAHHMNSMRLCHYVSPFAI